MDIQEIIELAELRIRLAEGKMETKEQWDRFISLSSGGN